MKNVTQKRFVSLVHARLCLTTVAGYCCSLRTSGMQLGNKHTRASECQHLPKLFSTHALASALGCARCKARPCAWPRKVFKLTAHGIPVRSLSRCCYHEHGDGESNKDPPQVLWSTCPLPQKVHKPGIFEVSTAKNLFEVRF